MENGPSVSGLKPELGKPNPIWKQNDYEPSKTWTSSEFYPLLYLGLETSLNQVLFWFQKLSKAKACADVGLLDTNVFQRCLVFFSSVAEFLLRQMTNAAENVSGNDASCTEVVVKLPLPSETSQRFAALPEWIIDDMADFMLFALQWVICNYPIWSEYRLYRIPAIRIYLNIIQLGCPD